MGTEKLMGGFDVELARSSEKSKKLHAVDDPEGGGIEVNYERCGREDHRVDLVP